MVDQIKRHTAYKVKIKDILDSKYVKGEGEWSPNYLEVSGLEISRVNLIGVLVSDEVEQNYRNMLVDDGSGRISIRSFEDLKNDVGVGDIVLVIGRPREFGSERYIVPEIVKKVEDKKWMDLRKLELKSDDEVVNNELQDVVDEDTPIAEESIAEVSDPVDNVFDFIKKKDSGDGVDTQEIIDKSGIENSENIIKNLLETGEIFEIKPGKLKVLE